MGWTSYHATYYKNGKIDRKTELDKGMNETHYRIIKSAMKGTTYYAAIETISTGQVWAAVILTATDNKDYYNFSYKAMDETEHPYKYDCPASILDVLTETDNKQANDWRAACRKQAELKKAGKDLNKLPCGTKVKWIYGLDGEYKILTKHAPAYQFRTWFWYDAANNKYIKKASVRPENTEIIEEAI